MSEKVGSKLDRTLDIYTSLLNGETIAIEDYAEKYGVSIKAITRDFEDIRLFLSDYNLKKAENLEIVNVEESRREHGRYRLLHADNKYLSRAQIIAVCKILMDSRSLNDGEMSPIVQKLINSTVSNEDKRFIRELLQNEWHNYIQPSHGKMILDNLLSISRAVKEQRIIRLKYTKSSNGTVERIIEPLGVIFSEYYFYLAGNIKDIDKDVYFQIKGDENPTMYRIDRIAQIELLDERYTVQEAKRFKEGEYRRRIQFMYGGELNKIKLLVKGFALEAVKDHLATARVTPWGSDGYDHVVEAELFGDGVLMWLMGQGDGVKLVEPQKLLDKLAVKARTIHELYNP